MDRKKNNYVIKNKQVSSNAIIVGNRKGVRMARANLP